MHHLPHWRCPIIFQSHFVVHLSSHASSDSEEDHIGNAVHNTCQSIIAFAISAASDATQDNRKIEQTITATDETNIILIQSQLILLTDDIRSCRNSRSGAYASLEAHAGNWTGGFTHFPRLQTAAAAKVSLAAFVVTPSTAWIHVIQNFMTHVHLSRTDA